MSYEPKPGVLTEEDKARMVLGNTGHDVDVAEILEVVFEAGNEKPEADADESEKKDEAETAIPKTADLSDTQQEVLETQASTMEQMTDAPETGGPSSHIDGNPLDEGDTDEAHASETNIASDESADKEGSDEPLADPLENKTVEPDAGKATPGLGNDEPAPSTDESPESASADAPELSTDSTPSFSDEPGLADSTATDADAADSAEFEQGTDSVEDSEGADSTTTDSGLV